MTQDYLKRKSYGPGVVDDATDEELSGSFDQSQEGDLVLEEEKAPRRPRKKLRSLMDRQSDHHRHLAPLSREKKPTKKPKPSRDSLTTPLAKYAGLPHEDDIIMPSREEEIMPAWNEASMRFPREGPRSTQWHIDRMPITEDWFVNGLAQFKDESLAVYLVKLYPDRWFGFPSMYEKIRLRDALTFLVPYAQLVTENDHRNHVWFLVGIPRGGKFPDLERHDSRLREVGVRKFRDGYDPLKVAEEADRAQAVEEVEEEEEEYEEEEEEEKAEEEGVAQSVWRPATIRYENGRFVSLADLPGDGDDDNE